MSYFSVSKPKLCKGSQKLNSRKDRMKLLSEKSLITTIFKGLIQSRNKINESIPLSTFILLPSCTNSSSVMFLILYPHIFHLFIGFIMNLIIMEAALTLVNGLDFRARLHGLESPGMLSEAV